MDIKKMRMLRMQMNREEQAEESFTKKIACLISNEFPYEISERDLEVAFMEYMRSKHRNDLEAFISLVDKSRYHPVDGRFFFQVVLSDQSGEESIQIASFQPLITESDMKKLATERDQFDFEELFQLVLEEFWMYLRELLGDCLFDSLATEKGCKISINMNKFLYSDE